MLLMKLQNNEGQTIDQIKIHSRIELLLFGINKSEFNNLTVRQLFKIIKQRINQTFEQQRRLKKFELLDLMYFINMYGYFYRVNKNYKLIF